MAHQSGQVPMLFVWESTGSKTELWLADPQGVGSDFFMAAHLQLKLSMTYLPGELALFCGSSSNFRLRSLGIPKAIPPRPTIMSGGLWVLAYEFCSSSKPIFSSVA